MHLDLVGTAHQSHPMRSTRRYPGVIVPDFCTDHQHDLIVNRLEIPVTGLWQEAYNAAQLMLLRLLLEDGRVANAAKDDPTQITFALQRVGCLACHDRRAYERVVLVLRKGPTHAAGVVEGTVFDADWERL